MGNNNTIIALSVALLLLMFFFFACSKMTEPDTSNTHQFSENSGKKVTEKPKKREKRTQNSSHSHASSRSASSSGHSGDSSVKISEEDIKAMIAFRETAITRQNESIQSKIKKVLEDPDADPALKTHYKLISSASYREAEIALRQEDYKQAAQKYAEMLKDSNSTPPMQYVALDGIRLCAQKMGDVKLYIATIKQLGIMIKNEDLAVLDVEQTGDYLEWAQKFERYMTARTDSRAMDDLMKEQMTRFGRSREAAQKRIQDEIKTFESVFPEFALQ